MVIALEEAWALSLVPPAIWLHRLRTYQQAVLRGRIFVWMVRTSWLSETFAWSRVQQKVSGCFRSKAFAQAFSRIRGYLSTLRKRGTPLLSALQATLCGHPVLPSR